MLTDIRSCSATTLPFVRARSPLIALCLLMLIALAAPRVTHALTVAEVRHASQATLKVYQVRHPSQADLKIHWVDHASQARGDALWFRARYPAQTAHKLFFVRYRSQADITIYVVEHANQAGWNGPPRGLQSGR